MRYLILIVRFITCLYKSLKKLDTRVNKSLIFMFITLLSIEANMSSKESQNSK